MKIRIPLFDEKQHKEELKIIKKIRKAIKDEDKATEKALRKELKDKQDKYKEKK